MQESDEEESYHGMVTHFIGVSLGGNEKNRNEIFLFPPKVCLIKNEACLSGRHVVVFEESLLRACKDRKKGKHGPGNELHYQIGREQPNIITKLSSQVRVCESADPF